MSVSEHLRIWFLTSGAWRVTMIGISLLNIVFGWPQARRVWRSRDMSNVSPLSMWLLLIVQWGFSTNAWAMRDWFMCVSGSLAGCCTASILVRIYGLKYRWL